MTVVHAKKTAVTFTAAFTLCAVLIYLAFTAPLPEFAAAEIFAKAAAVTTLPEGGAELAASSISLLGKAPEQEPPPDIPASAGFSSESEAHAEAVTSSEASSSAEEPPPVGYGTVTERFYSSSGANLTWENVYVSKKIDVPLDIAQEISAGPDIAVAKNGEPQVLIMHTHATESYLAEDTGVFAIGGATRSIDEAQNMIAVGAEIAARLNAAGIVTLQDKTLHDYPSYNGSYDRSEVTVKKYLEQYPSIKSVLDIHRDAISVSDTKKIKPTVTVNGKKAAQVMIICGCEYGNVTGYPNWRENLRFGLRVQQSMEDLYPGLARPLLFDDRKYNQHLTNGSILIEMGSDSNTLEEAKYSGQLVGNALVKVFEELQ